VLFGGVTRNQWHVSSSSSSPAERHCGRARITEIAMGRGDVDPEGEFIALWDARGGIPG